MSVINLIIKPTSECNLRCKYCYHASTNYVCGTIEKAKLEKLLDLASNEYKDIKITWHGGEPMLLGIKFYEEIFKFQKELEKKKNVSFFNTFFISIIHKSSINAPAISQVRIWVLIIPEKPITGIIQFFLYESPLISSVKIFHIP